MPTDLLPTPKQLAFAVTLISERDIAVDELPRTRAKMSEFIDMLLAQPKKSAAPVAAPKTVEPVADLTAGIYVAPNGDVIKIQLGKGSGKPYAKVAVDIKGERLNLLGEPVKFEYVYVPGLIKFVTPAMKMTAAQAEEYGLKFGVCMFCGRGLKVAKSVLAGMGPVCAKKFA